MIIFDYRENEINEAHPVSHLLNSVKKMNTNVTRINLSNLDHESTNNIISHALHVSPFETCELTAWVQENTAGKAFFVNEILKSLA